MFGGEFVDRKVTVKLVTVMGFTYALCKGGSNYLLGFEPLHFIMLCLGGVVCISVRVGGSCR